MMDLFDFLIAFSIGWFGGQWYMGYQLRRNIEKIAAKYGMTFEEWSDSLNQVVKDSVKKVPKMFTEHIGNSIYLYNKDTGGFVAQAESLEELAKLIAIEHSMVIVVDKDKMFLLSEGKVQTELNESKTS